MDPVSYTHLLVDIFEKLGFRQIPERLGLKVQDERIKKTPDIVEDVYKRQA